MRIVEERHEQNAKRRKLDMQSSGIGTSVSPSPSLFLTAPPITPSVHPSLPPRPVYDFAATADSIGLGAPPNSQSIQNIPTAVQALAGSNHDVVANRRAIRMANMSAGEILKAELFGLAPTKPDLSLPPKPTTVLASDAIPTSRSALLEATKMSMDVQPVSDGITAYGVLATTDGAAVEDTFPVSDVDADGEPDPDVPDDIAEASHAGTKRRHDEFEEDIVESLGSDDDDTPAGPLALKVNPDGTVDQEDRVKHVSSFHVCTPRLPVAH
jgi:5'-3' exoribonuclease 2